VGQFAQERLRDVEYGLDLTIGKIVDRDDVARSRSVFRGHGSRFLLLSRMSAMPALGDARRAKAGSRGHLGATIDIMSALTHKPQPLRPVEPARSWRGDVH